MTDFLLEGSKLFISGNYELAGNEFTKMLMQEKTTDKVLAFLYRGTCCMELGKFDIALDDFKQGLELNQSSFELKYKSGLALFKLKRFEEADQAFRGALISSTNSEEREKLLLWQNKTKLEVDSIIEQKAKKIGGLKFSHNWYQTDNSVTITFDSNTRLDPKIISVKIEKRSLSILFEDVVVHHMTLSNAIDEAGSKSKILTQKIEVNLVKDIKKFNWITLDEKSKEQVQQYPTSMKKDFNMINREIEEQMKKEKTDPDGNEAMMYLFKEIYKNADENTKRAMMKSYSTSGGTVMSTNWSEVSDKDYSGKDRPDAPDGQMWADQKK